LAAKATKRRRLVIIASFRSSPSQRGGALRLESPRYGVPLIGIRCGVHLEPLALARRRHRSRRRRALLFVYAEVGPNVADGGEVRRGVESAAVTRRTRRVSAAEGKGFTRRRRRCGSRALNGFLPKGGRFSTSRRANPQLPARRKPARAARHRHVVTPILFAEAMRQLEKNPPPVVIVSGAKDVDVFDELPNRERVPKLFEWIDAPLSASRAGGAVHSATDETE